MEKIEVFISKELNAYLGSFQIPPEITNYISDKDLMEYDKNLTAMDIRCGLIQSSLSLQPNKENNNINTEYESPTIKPSVISIYTNIPISDRANERLINGGIYQLHHQKAKML